MKLEIPDAFIVSTVAREGAEGRTWINHLPAVVRECCERWDLVPDGPPLHGYVGLVVPVLQAGIGRMLKVSWIDVDSVQEPLALRLWDGRGAVRLIAEDPGLGAMLLERLNHRRSLEHIPIQEASAIAGRLLRRLAIPAPPEVRTLAREVEVLCQHLPESWQRGGRPFPRKLLEQVLEAAAALDLQKAPLVVNSDLHYENVLSAEREPWLVIDPKILAGDLAYGVVPLLWNRFDEMRSSIDFERRFSGIVEAAELDADRARSWSLVRVVAYWLWALGVGLTEDSKKCPRLVEWLT